MNEPLLTEPLSLREWGRLVVFMAAIVLLCALAFVGAHRRQADAFHEMDREATTHATTR